MRKTLSAIALTAVALTSFVGVDTADAETQTHKSLTSPTFIEWRGVCHNLYFGQNVSECNTWMGGFAGFKKFLEYLENEELAIVLEGKLFSYKKISQHRELAKKMVKWMNR
jgi:hypothetical protein